MHYLINFDNKYHCDFSEKDNCSKTVRKIQAIVHINFSQITIIFYFLDWREGREKQDKNSNSFCHKDKEALFK